MRSIRLTVIERRTAALAAQAAFAAAAVLTVLGPAAVRAAGYPNHPVRMVVPFPAGGSADLLTRIVAEKMATRWGQPVVVENRPGAAGNIGAELVYKAEPDGYTLLSTPAPVLAVNLSLYPHLSYDATQFVAITVIAAVPSVLLVHPSLPVDDIRGFIAYARAHPGKLNYASQGSGTTSHLTTELLKSMAGLDMTHVPYKGTAPAMADLIAGQVDVLFDNLGTSLPYIRSGKLRALAVGSVQRDPALPQVPAMDEVLPGFTSAAWFAIVAPPKTPPDIAAAVQSAVAEAERTPDVEEKLREMAARPMAITPAETSAFFEQERERWRKVIQQAKVRVD